MTVSVEWYGCATFRVRVGGRTLWFDTYLDKAPGVPSAGLGAAKVSEADILFISHAHFDHVLGADVIAKATGALVVGNHETAHLMAACGVPEGQIIPTAGGDRVDCGAGVHVRTLPALHSCLFAGAALSSEQSCLGDLGMSAQDRRARERGIFDALPRLSEDVQAYFADVEGRTSARDGGSSRTSSKLPRGRCS